MRRRGKALSMRGEHVVARPLQFELRHLLLAIAFAALYVTAIRFVTARADQGQAPWPLFILGSLVAGVAWSLTAVLIFDKLAGRKTPLAPAEWLILVGGLSLALGVITEVIGATTILRAEAFMPAVICCVYVLPTLSRQLPAHWKAFFMLGLLLQIAVIGVNLLLNRGGGLWTDLLVWRRVFIGGLCVVLLGIDWRGGRRPTWLQIVGIVVFFSVL